VVSTMADPIYGIHQSQPRDIFDYMKANGKRLGLEGRFSYMPILREKAENGRIVGLVDGLEMAVSDEIAYYDEVLMDGRTRRYAKIRILMSAFGSYQRTPQIVSVENEMKELGYTQIEIVKEYNSFDSYRLDFNLPQSYSDDYLFNYAEIVEIKAGVPTYYNSAHAVVDAPFDGEGYARVNGTWVLSDHMVHPDIDGGTATV